MLKGDVSCSSSDGRVPQPSAGSPLSVSAGRRAGRRPVCGVLSVQTCTAAIAGRCPTARNGGPAGPGLAVSAADTRVSVSGSGRLQSADAALCLTGPGQAPVTLLEMGTDSDGDVWVTLRQPTDDLLAALPGLRPRLRRLDITGEQRQHLQAGDVPAGLGMANTGQCCIVPTLPQDTCDEMLCFCRCVG